MKTYQLYDSLKQQYVTDEFGNTYITNSEDDAFDYKWHYLHKNQYPHFPVTLVMVHEYEDGICNGEVIDIILN